MDDVCNFTMRRIEPDKPARTAWCLTHKRWAELCDGDPIDATLSHLNKDAEPKAKTCPHCGGDLDR